ncbi:MAG: hypothetical protein JW729_06915, partial [Bacteroidales bacterium]|nr:hypothetical protein [Bacteroidales bacterium]
HVYLSKESYAKNKEGYLLEMHDNDFILNYKNGDTNYSLTETANNFVFFSKEVEVCFSKGGFQVKDIQIKDKSEQLIHLQKAAEMRFILEGAKLLSPSI